LEKLIKEEGNQIMPCKKRLDDFNIAERKWKENTLKNYLLAFGERKPKFSTDSGIEIKSLYTPKDLDNGKFNYLNELGFPGEFPFTRGVTPTMYRSDLYKIAQFAGFATPEETNKLYRKLLDQGATSLYMACDLPCQLGYDSDDPRSEGEVGKVGVPINSLKDMEIGRASCRERV